MKIGTGYGIVDVMRRSGARQLETNDIAEIPKHLRINLHSHSAFSDGQYTPEALVLQAIEKGVSVLGISDHYFTRKTPSIKPNMLCIYLDELDRIAKRFEGKIRILKAIEINTLEHFLLGLDFPEPDLLNRLDYLLFEYVTNIPRAGIPLRHAVLMAKESGLPCGLAHTDLAMAFPNLQPEELIHKLLSAGMFIELNESYRRPGERHPFYEHYHPYLNVARKMGLIFSAGTDVHHQITGSASRAISFLIESGLQDQLLSQHL